jgi:hypothetical protein
VEDRRISEFTRLAAAVQRQRHEDQVSPSERITRSTGMWTLMELDSSLKATVERGGVTQSELAEALSVQTVPTPAPTDNVQLDGGFEAAMRDYLADRPRQPTIDLLDLAAAIVRDVRDRPGGLLPERLKHFKYETVLSIVDRFDTDSHSALKGVINRPPLSGTMRAVAEELSGRSTSSADPDAITSLAIANRHHDYAGDRLGTVAFSSLPGATTRTWSEWEDQVAGLYDGSVLATSTHEVLDGRLFLVGLAILDPPLRDVLATHGV